MIFRSLMNDMSWRNIQTSCKQGQIPTGEVTSPTMRSTRFPIASVLPSLRHNSLWYMCLVWQINRPRTFWETQISYLDTQIYDGKIYLINCSPGLCHRVWFVRWWQCEKELVVNLFLTLLRQTRWFGKGPLLFKKWLNCVAPVRKVLTPPPGRCHGVDNGVDIKQDQAAEPWWPQLQASKSPIRTLKAKPVNIKTNFVPTRHLQRRTWHWQKPQNFNSFPLSSASLQCSYTNTNPSPGFRTTVQLRHVFVQTSQTSTTTSRTNYKQHLASNLPESCEHNWRTKCSEGCCGSPKSRVAHLVCNFPPETTCVWTGIFAMLTQCASVPTIRVVLLIGCRSGAAGRSSWLANGIVQGLCQLYIGRMAGPTTSPAWLSS